jgi:hypothetical protein
VKSQTNPFSAPIFYNALIPAGIQAWCQPFVLLNTKTRGIFLGGFFSNEGNVKSTVVTTAATGRDTIVFLFVTFYG